MTSKPEGPASDEICDWCKGTGTLKWDSGSPRGLSSEPCWCQVPIERWPEGLVGPKRPALNKGPARVVEKFPGRAPDYFAVMIGGKEIYTDEHRFGADEVCDRINSALSGMVERSVVDGLVEALASISKSKHFYTVSADREREPNLYRVQLGAQTVASTISEQAEVALAAYESKMGRG